MYDETFVYKSPKCAYLSAGELVVKSTSGDMFVTSHIDHRNYYRQPVSTVSLKADATATAYARCAGVQSDITDANMAQCTGTGTSILGSSPNRKCCVGGDDGSGNCDGSNVDIAVGTNTVTSNHGVRDAPTAVNGICTYMTNTNLFPVGIEKINMEILHEFDTLSDNYGAVNPPTRIRRKGDDTDRKTIAAGSAIVLTVEELLEIAGVDLDKPYDQQPGGQVPLTTLQGKALADGSLSSAGAFPYPRLTGVRVAVDIKYYNYNKEMTEGFSELGTSDVYAIVEVEARNTWTSRGQDITYRNTPWEWNQPVDSAGAPSGGFEDMYVYGINIDVSVTGVVAAFNFQLFIQTIVSGLVFLGVAKNVCDLLAMYGMGVKSKLYKTFIQEEVDLERECARYAIQALMASEFFKKKDEDGSGNLDLDEVQTMLRETFNADTDDGENVDEIMNLSDKEISSLALYILRSCDDDRENLRLQGKEKGFEELSTSSISLREFINISTEDTVNVKILKEIVNLTNLDEMVATASEGIPEIEYDPKNSV